MKKFAILAAVGVAISAPAAAAPGNSSSAEGQARAQIVAPITITHDGGWLSFGTIVPGTVGGTVQVDQGGGATVTGDAVLVAGTTPVSADSFTVTGDAGRQFNLTSTNSTVDLGAESMPFTTLVDATPVTLTGGSVQIFVGGELTVGASQAPGVYEGTYSVTATYN